jgi:two-component system, LuxR family, response regulator FixJ
MFPAAVFSNEIFIVDADAAVRHSFSLQFTLEGYRVATFRDGPSFVVAARTRLPVCVLLDVELPGKSGLDVLKEIDAWHYPAPVFIMSGHGDVATAVEAIRDGACDFIEKRLDAGAMVARVRETIDGWAHRRQQDGTRGEPPSRLFPGCDRLTPRERDVLSEITAAASNKEAAKTLGISPRTVEIHRVHIMQKLRAKNTADLFHIVMNTERYA